VGPDLQAGARPSLGRPAGRNTGPPSMAPDTHGARWACASMPTGRWLQSRTLIAGLWPLLLVDAL